MIFFMRVKDINEKKIIAYLNKFPDSGRTPRDLILRDNDISHKRFEFASYKMEDKLQDPAQGYVAPKNSKVMSFNLFGEIKNRIRSDKQFMIANYFKHLRIYFKDMPEDYLQFLIKVNPTVELACFDEGFIIGDSNAQVMAPTRETVNSKDGTKSAIAEIACSPLTSMYAWSYSQFLAKNVVKKLHNESPFTFPFEIILQEMKAFEEMQEALTRNFDRDKLIEFGGISNDDQN